MRTILIIPILFLGPMLLSQVALKPGFAMLERGDFEDAEIFFEEALVEMPQNKTVRLCHGRAVGLNGRPQKALGIFQKMKLDFPQDYEILLNEAEAFMWSKQFKVAKKSYEKLVKIEPHNFTALLGLANSSNECKLAESALLAINRALEEDMDNASALVSKKYILLNLAVEKRLLYQFEEGIDYLKQILSIYPNDQDALNNIATFHILKKDFDKSASVYNYMIREGLDSLEAYLGLSYVSLLANNKEMMLDYAETALSILKKNDTRALKSYISYINALAINDHFEKAKQVLSKVENIFGGLLEIEITKAKIMQWSHHEKQALEYYKLLLQEHKDNFDLSIAKVDALRALQQKEKALKEIKHVLMIRPSSIDAKKIEKELQLETANVLQIAYQTSHDIISNEQEIFEAKIKLTPSDNFHYNFEAVQINACFHPMDIRAKQSIFKIGADYFINENSTLGLDLNLLNVTGRETKQSSRMLMNLRFSQKINHKNQFTLFFNSEAHNYSVDLIDQNLDMHHLGVNYNYSSKKYISLFTQYMYTYQNDNNVRKLFFASAYHTFKHLPLINVGVNYTSLSFSQNEILYFSPHRFSNIELFTLISNKHYIHDKWKYHLLAAVGNQNIYELEKQNTLRLELGGGYSVSNELSLYGQYAYSNAAQTSTGGYRFQKYTLELKYMF